MKAEPTENVICWYSKIWYKIWMDSGFHSYLSLVRRNFHYYRFQVILIFWKLLNFFFFYSLTSLDLNQCKIAEVHNLAFNGLGTLRSLKLGDNNLSEVPSEALRRVPNLHSIHLEQNPFVTLSAEVLSPVCSQLKRLDISGCSKLTSIQAHAFQGKYLFNFSSNHLINLHLKQRFSNQDF